MTSIERIVRAVLEADDDFDMGDEPAKDILGPNFGAGPDKGSKEGYVERHGRWADVAIGDDHWCISYLTPVAVFINGEGPFITEKYWSQATTKHIKKWAEEIGWGSGMTWQEIQQRAKRMSQQDLIDRFKKAQGLVKWTRRQADKLEKLPEIGYCGLKSCRDDRVELEPYEEPE